MDDIGFSDEQLASMANNGDNLALDNLMNRYKYLVKIIGRQYFILGADGEDVAQEGMIGLYKAIREYNPAQAAFRTFADICIKRQILTAIKAAARKKHGPLNKYISIDCDDAPEIPDLPNPEDIIINREGKMHIEARLGAALSTFEYKILIYFLQGNSYSEMAAALNCNEKSVDNALSRIRKKIIKIIDAD
ncbi:MAG: sigma-70 family RNA polymerase sigma factor [Defluviitaleaceae bacterium]|nr:sigma-70 family RNA polymerase sigma factor [Defluviitaleaceae bacterium]